MGIADSVLGKPVPVKLAGRDFVVKIVPMARVRRLGDVVQKIATELQGANVESTDGIDTIINKLLGFPHALLSIFIDDLPEDIFMDDENGVTFPDFWDVLQIALTINRVDALKNVFSRLGPSLMQASTSPKTS